MSITATGQSGQVICDESVTLPSFVVGEELTKNKSSLKEECPPEVTAVLNEKGALVEYKLLINELVENKKTQKKLSNWWVNEEILRIMSDYNTAFRAKGLDLALCERSKQGTTHKYLWIEFVDLAKADPEYMSDYDVRRLEDGEEIRMEYEKIKFPTGVYTERLRGYNGRSKLAKKIPEALEAFLERKDARPEYDELIKAVVATPGAGWGVWKDGEVNAVVSDHRVQFKVKGIDIYACRKNQWVHTYNGGYNHSYRWIEFVDRDVLENYEPARGNLEDKKEDDCIII